MTSKHDYSKNSLPEISSFSKHLMLMVIAVFAMLTPLLNSSNDNLVKFFLYLTLLLVLISFYFGHEVLTGIINLYTNPQIKDIIFHDIKPVITTVRRQFILSILSVVCLVLTYGFHVMNTSNAANDKFKIIAKRIKALEIASIITKSNKTKIDLHRKNINDIQEKIKQKNASYKTTLTSIKSLAIEQEEIRKQFDMLAKEIERIKKSQYKKEYQHKKK